MKKLVAAVAVIAVVVVGTLVYRSHNTPAAVAVRASVTIPRLGSPLSTFETAWGAATTQSNGDSAWQPCGHTYRWIASSLGGNVASIAYHACATHDHQSSAPYVPADVTYKQMSHNTVLKSAALAPLFPAYFLACGGASLPAGTFSVQRNWNGHVGDWRMAIGEPC